MAKTHCKPGLPLANSLVKRFFIACSWILIPILLLSFTARADGITSAPSLDHSPDEVVAIVVEALRTNSEDDAGIATVFRFASPENKAMTGPLARFVTMLRNGFVDMLNHTSSETEALEVRDGVAIQPVWLTTPAGQEVGYLFRLSKQTEGEFAGMWMTDAVYPLQKRGQSI